MLRKSLSWVLKRLGKKEVDTAIDTVELVEEDESESETEIQINSWTYRHKRLHRRKRAGRSVGRFPLAIILVAAAMLILKRYLGL